MPRIVNGVLVDDVEVDASTGRRLTQAEQEANRCGGAWPFISYGWNVCGTKIPLLLMLAICLILGFTYSPESAILCASGFAILAAISKGMTPSDGTTLGSSGSSGSGASRSRIRTVRDLPQAPARGGA